MYKLVFVEERKGVFRLRARYFCRGTKVPKSPPGLRPRPPWGAIRRMEKTCSARVENRMNSYPRPLPLIFHESDGTSLSRRASEASIAGCVPFLGRLSVEPGGTVGTIQARLYP